jgi:hypothetical protein
MHQGRIGVIVLLLALWLPLNRSAAGIRTSFAAKADLSPKDLEQVVELSHKCGIKNVTEITTAYGIPGHYYRGITVRGDETVNGRKITYYTLEVMKENWSRDQKPAPGQGFVIVGPFWASSALQYEPRTEFILKPQSTDLRVQILGEVSLETADKIVAAFSAGKIEFADENIHNQVETPTFERTRRKPNYTQPTCIVSTKSDRGTDAEQPKGDYWISFYGRFDRFYIELHGDKVKIVAKVQVEV